MRIPVLAGTIDRRLLVNLRVEPEVVAGLLPEPFRPQVIGGFGVAGVDFVRLAKLRPVIMPAGLGGFTSEIAVHRIAVEWDADGTICTGVYMPRRDTSSRLTRVIGSRFFPGVHALARFSIEEGGGRYDIGVTSHDDTMRVRVIAHTTTRFPENSVFGSVKRASAFFEREVFGYGPSFERKGTFEGLELHAEGWEVTPLSVEEFSSSYFDDDSLFPPGTIALDSGLLIRGGSHELHARDPIVALPGWPAWG